MKRAVLLLLCSCQAIHVLPPPDAGSPGSDAGTPRTPGIACNAPSCPEPTLCVVETFDGGFANTGWVNSDPMNNVFLGNTLDIYGSPNAPSTATVTYPVAEPGYDLRGRSVFVEAVDFGTFKDGGDDGMYSYFEIAVGSRRLRIAEHGANLYATDDGGMVGFANPIPNPPLYWRFREDGGTVYLEWTTDGGWNNLASVQADAENLLSVSLGLDSPAGDKWPALFANLDVCH